MKLITDKTKCVISECDKIILGGQEIKIKDGKIVVKKKEI